MEEMLNLEWPKATRKSSFQTEEMLSHEAPWLQIATALRTTKCDTVVRTPETRTALGYLNGFFRDERKKH